MCSPAQLLPLSIRLQTARRSTATQRLVSGCGSLFDLGNEVGGLPVVGGVPGCYFAVFSDDDCGEGVGEGFGVAGGDAYVEELSDGGKVFFVRGRRSPSG